MRETERQTRSYLMELFERHGFHPRTDRGQNFLIDLNIIEYIVERADLRPDDVVLEIGAGTGGMTTWLAQQAAHVVSVEVDPHMHQLAAEAVATFDNVTLLNCDALKNKNTFHPQLLHAVQEKLEETGSRRLKLVANLPYNIATPVVSNLVATDWPWERMVVTIQLELGERMSARPRTADYSALSVWLQSQCFVKILKKLPPAVFWPRPKVFSAVVQLVPNPRRRQHIADRDFLHDFLRRLFTQRRKLLRSALAGMYRKELTKPRIDAILAEAGFSETARAEELDVDTLIDLSNRFRQAVGGDRETGRKGEGEMRG